MSLARLASVLRPPDVAVETTGAVAWDEVTRRLGILLPHDYREFVETYGTGEIDGFIGINNPFSYNRNVNLCDVCEELLPEFRASPYQLPFPLFPDPGGLLPMGGTGNGDLLFWRTRGAPAEWSVVVNATRDVECEEYAMPMTAFLAELLDGTLKSEILGDEFLVYPHRFTPMRVLGIA